MSDPSEPRQPPRPPQFTPPPDYPPTAQFPTVDPNAGYQPPPPGYGTPGYPPPPPGYTPPPPGYTPPPPGYEPRPPRRSNVPLIALVLAVTLLLCGGVVTASVILARKAADKAEELAEPIINPSLPELPTEAPDFPGLPTDFPDMPALPTDIPGFGAGKEINVTYEVTGDGPAEIVYMEKLDGALKRVGNAKLPWKITTTMKSPAVVSVTAVRTGVDSGSISCRATVDGDQAAQHSAEGALATATCNQLIMN